MKYITKTFAVPFALMCVMMIASSCQKDNSAVPADEVLAPGEVEMKQPDPGTYTITKFIDTGDDETAQFNGYTFKFKTNGNLIATAPNGDVFNGSWSLNSAETVMTINITGTPALDDLDDDDWNVVKITNQKIKIKKNGPDIVVFEKI